MTQRQTGAQAFSPKVFMLRTRAKTCKPHVTWFTSCLMCATPVQMDPNGMFNMIVWFVVSIAILSVRSSYNWLLIEYVWPSQYDFLTSCTCSLNDMYWVNVLFFEFKHVTVRSPQLLPVERTSKRGIVLLDGSGGYLTETQQSWNGTILFVLKTTRKKHVFAWNHVSWFKQFELFGFA